MIDEFYRRVSEIYALADVSVIEALNEAYLLFKWKDKQNFQEDDFTDAIEIIDALIDDIKGRMRDPFWKTGR